jgi:hypothetical protein
MIFALMYLAGCAALVLGPAYVVVWFVNDVRKSFSVGGYFSRASQRELDAARKRNIVAQRRIAEARRSIVGYDL